MNSVDLLRWRLLQQQQQEEQPKMEIRIVFVVVAAPIIVEVSADPSDMS
jgi:hypothetical protein